MAEIRPFKGVRYDKGSTGGDISAVVAPPYDVISDSKRDDLYNRSPFNIVRLILGKEVHGDNGDNKYKRAASVFNEWRRQGIMVEDPLESFYIHSQEYSYKGTARKRTGFFGILKIDEDGTGVLPHERTHSRPKEDRLNLISAVKANLSPIFTLFFDTSGKANSLISGAVNRVVPETDITIDGVRHMLWKVSDQKVLKKLSGVLEDKKLFIADGHHRYEVARKYRDLKRAEPGYNGEADFVMMYFADMADPENLTVMATHRVIRAMPISSLGEIKDKLNPYFSLLEHEELSSLVKRMEETQDSGKIFGMLSRDGYITFEPRQDVMLDELIDEDRTDDWKALDVSILHSAVLDRILSVSSEEGNITYVKDAREAEQLVKSGSHQAAFILNPTRVEQMKAVAEHGEVMPQKSTYFYPKLLTGLVINELGV